MTSINASYIIRFRNDTVSLKGDKMVKTTFDNLSKEKQEELIAIAKQEFASHPINEVTVKNIAKSYGIARSSFYNYFDSVLDLLYYVLDDYKKKIIMKFKNCIEYNKGDVFKTIIDVFEYIIDCNELDFLVFKNIFINANPLIQKMIIPNEKNNFCEEIDFLIKKIDEASLNIDSNDIVVLIELLLDLLIEGIIHFFIDDINKDVAKTMLKRKIDIVKFGVLKE